MVVMTDYSVGTNIGKIASAINKLAGSAAEPHVTLRVSKSQVALLAAALSCSNAAYPSTVTERASAFLTWLNANSS
jgi:hypothetical protein